MEVTRVSMTVGGERVSGAQTWLLDGVVGEGTQRVFRQVLYLRFGLDGYADAIRIVPAQTQVRGRFLAYDYDAKSVANPALAAQLSNADNAVVVQLDAPRQLRTVRLSNTLAPGASSKVTVHRVDGNQVVEEATAEAGWNSVFATADLVNIQVNRALPLRAVASGTTAMTNNQTPKLSQGSNVAAFATDFTDARFALRLRNSPITLMANHLTGLTMRSYPSAPRLGLAEPQALTAPSFFLRLTGEIGKDGDANAGQVDAGALLAGALQQAVDTFFAQRLDTATTNPPLLPSHFDVALVLESDAPCQLQLDEFRVGYELVRRNFADYAEKRVLRFAGTAVETQRISIPLPGSATVTQATLTVATKLTPAELSDQAMDTVLQGDALTQTTGIHLGLARWAAQPVTPRQALTASGVMLALVGLTPNAQVTLELYADWQGQPAGEKLTAVTFSLAQSGQRRWQTVSFPEPVLLFAQPYWLLLKAVRGAALWLAQTGTPAVQMVIQETQRWQPLNVIANTQGLLHWLTPVSAAQQAPFLALHIAETPVLIPPVATDDRQTYELTAALNGALANKGTTALVDLPLAITTGAAGLLTLYPPVITYSSEA